MPSDNALLNKKTVYFGNIYEDFFFNVRFIWDCNIFVVRNFSVFPWSVVREVSFKVSY